MQRIPLNDLPIFNIAAMKIIERKSIHLYLAWQIEPGVLDEPLFFVLGKLSVEYADMRKELLLFFKKLLCAFIEHEQFLGYAYTKVETPIPLLSELCMQKHERK